MIVLRRLLPLILLAAAFAAIWWSGVSDQLSWSGLARNQTMLANWVGEHPLFARIGFVGLYAVATALSIPQGALLTIAGGLLFGVVVGTGLTVVGATTGAVLLFIAASSALREPLSRRGGQTMVKLREALRRDGFSYLLAIRLLPLFPFWVVNLAASVSGMRLRTFATATMLGIIPATLVYSSVGAGVGSVLAAGGKPNLTIIFSLPILGPLVGLALLSLIPVAWKKWKRSGA